MCSSDLSRAGSGRFGLRNWSVSAAEALRALGGVPMRRRGRRRPGSAAAAAMRTEGGAEISYPPLFSLRAEASHGMQTGLHTALESTYVQVWRPRMPAPANFFAGLADMRDLS